jgi:GDP-4-dehydro-6-deoxy-D-mannose reductase
MRILVTGACGFVGRHLVAELLAHRHEPVALDLGECPADFPATVSYHRGDIANAGQLRQAVAEIRPEGCIHLAGLAFVPIGWSDPARMMQVNLIGAINLLEALRHGAPEARLLLISSAEVYGRKSLSAPLTEDAPLQPDNPYALSKSAAESMVFLYGRSYGMPTMAARPCNHIGPGQSADFVISSFAVQLRKMASGACPPVMKVGNLDSLRMFLDVRDVVRAYRLLLEDGIPGQAYNVAGGEEKSIREMLELLCQAADVQPRLEVDPARFRPTDRLPLLDASRLTRETGWRPQIHIAQTLRDIMAST